MSRALALAQLGIGKVAPNPLVGCVIVKNDRIIGEGYHQKFGESHAEVNAVASAHELVKGATVYVTLEPCAHHGKTSPCTALLIRSEVARVVIACQDPFNQVNGRGIEQLRAAGIRVDVPFMQQEAEYVNRRFLTAVLQKRPYVILKWAQTFDGFIARENFDSKWISTDASRQLVHKWRAEEGALLVGYNTAKYDDPHLTTRDWSGSNPLRIVLDPQNELDRALHIFNGQAQTIIISQKAVVNFDHVRFMEWDAKSAHMDVLLEGLNALGIQSLIVEGGARTLQQFIQNQTWDEARVFTSPMEFGAGIKAPVLALVPTEQKQSAKDNLAIYYNEKNR